jgi:phosphoglycolate phosphatase-like HAD superfamily hydrolase
MSESSPTVLALDFDGVVCDGMKEYFQTTWRAYRDLWHLEDSQPPAGLAENFYQVRPLIATGWEMPILIRALLLGLKTEMQQNWEKVRQDILAKEGLHPTQLAAAVDGVRDRWIATDLEGWLAEQRPYPGIIERLQELADSPVQVVIISTKEGRFIQQLLRSWGLALANLRLFGKEAGRPKHQILRELIAESTNGAKFWFVEDLLKTLQTVRKQPDLQAVELFLAEWGYNVQSDRDSIAHDPVIHLLSLEQFHQNFPDWFR